MAESSSKLETPVTVPDKMEELRLKCEKQVEVQMQGIDRSTDSFRKSMEFILQRVHDTVANQVELGKLKRRLRVEEDASVKAIAEKNRKEARKMLLTESLSSSRARADKLERILEEQRVRKNRYSAVISQQNRVITDLIDAEDKISTNSEVGQIQEAISWYNKALGFRIDSGHGIKFTFTNINPKNPNAEFSFTVRHSNETYTDCQPALAGMGQLVQELNKTNGLFKFVRTIRGIFFEAAASGATPHSPPALQEASVITTKSNPFSLTSSNTKSETSTKESKPRVSKELHRRGGEETMLSPGSASLPRRSPRLTPSHGPRT